MEHGVTINRPPRDGRMAFVRSPDNIFDRAAAEGRGAAAGGALGEHAEHRRLVTASRTCTGAGVRRRHPARSPGLERRADDARLGLQRARRISPAPKPPRAAQAPAAAARSPAPRLTSTSACCADTAASPSRQPRQPACSISQAADNLRSAAVDAGKTGMPSKRDCSSTATARATTGFLKKLPALPATAGSGSLRLRMRRTAAATLRGVGGQPAHRGEFLARARHTRGSSRRSSAAAARSP